MVLDEFIDDRERCLVFNLDPRVSVVPLESETNGLSFQLQHRDGASLHLVIIGGASFDVLPGAFSIGYMKSLENKRLAIRLSAHRAESVFSW